MKEKAYLGDFTHLIGDNEVYAGLGPLPTRAHQKLDRTSPLRIFEAMPAHRFCFTKDCMSTKKHFVVLCLVLPSTCQQPSGFMSLN